ncbi:MAG TPA: excinuclease ABC subunit UvrB [Acidimicrobiia bacterium]|nr:excinuclease ABC subunit UvrB [Acidimicrobiia bacterium]
MFGSCGNTRTVVFELNSEYEPSGDQPAAIDALVDGVEKGLSYQTLLGITGSGKSFTIASVIAKLNRPALIMAPNKSLAAQLASEFRGYFPNNRVEYFVSYYDYYQPEAYIAQTDTFIEKDSSINDEIDRLRHAATSALLSRRDTIIVASVSAIYGLGSPDSYKRNMLFIDKGDEFDQRSLLSRLVELQYERNDIGFQRNKFRVRGDTIDIFPAYEERVIRVELFGDDIDRISLIDPLTGEMFQEVDAVAIFPASHYVVDPGIMRTAIAEIENDLDDRLAELKKANKLVEEQRLRSRTEHDLEMMREVGVCSGIENYSRYLDRRQPGEAPYTLLNYFPEDFITILDESHVTVPQLRGQNAGDLSRKNNLVDYGFRLPSAKDNRPLRFEEVMERLPRIVFMSATPGPFEKEISEQVVEQIIRPTGLLDPEIKVRPTKGQIDDLINEIRESVDRGERVLVTTLTKKMAEDLTEYLQDTSMKVRYLHSDIDTIERIEILRDLRLGECDVVVGINLLREGLDLPEVSLVAILDADKEGFLRSQTSLIQTIGRAARNVNGRVIMYADKMTDSMRYAISETNRRRALQEKYNEENGINPTPIVKAVSDILDMLRGGESDKPATERIDISSLAELGHEEIKRLIVTLEDEMHEAAKELNFEEAARLRDEVSTIRKELKDMIGLA